MTSFESQFRIMHIYPSLITLSGNSEVLPLDTLHTLTKSKWIHLIKLLYGIFKPQACNEIPIMLSFK